MNCARRIAAILGCSVEEVRSGYLIDWIPEQCEAIYDIMLQDGSLYRIEMSYSSEGDIDVQKLDLHSYRGILGTQKIDAVNALRQEISGSK